MKLVRTTTIEGDFPQMLSQAKDGDVIVLFEDEEFDSWASHPQGVVVERGRQLLLNGEQVLFEGEVVGNYAGCSRGVIIQRGRQLLLNGEQVLFEGEFDDWEPHPQGIVIARGGKLLLVVYKS